MLLARGPGLVLSPYIPVKRDGKRREVYHVTTPTACSCSAERKPGEPCEHSSRFFSAEEAKAEKAVV